MASRIQNSDEKSYEKLNSKYFKLDEEFKQSLSQTSDSEVMRNFYRENFRYTKYRWLVLILIALTSFGGFYWYGIILVCQQSVKDNITGEDKNHFYKIDQLYAAVGYVSMFFALGGGYLIDKIGLNASFILFALVMVLGQAIFVIAAFVKGSGGWIYILAIAGRIIFGIGKNTLFICRQVAISKWFIGQELGLAFGTWISITSIAIALNMYISL